MDNSLQTSIAYDEHQLLKMLKDTIWKVLTGCIFYWLKIVELFIFPFVFMYLFWAHAIEQMWKITKYVWSEIFQLLEIMPLSIKAWYYSVMIVVQFLFLFKRLEEIAVFAEKTLYEVLKKICKILRIIPLSTKHAVSLYTVVDKFPLFGKDRLPFPHFLFEDTFTDISFRKNSVSMSVPLPPDFHQTGTAIAETQTNGDTPTFVQTPPTEGNIGSSEETHPSSGQPADAPSTIIPEIIEPIPSTSTFSLTKRPSKSDAKPVELSTDQNSSTSDVKTSSSSTLSSI